MKHYQFGGRCPAANKPLNTLKRGKTLTIYSINFERHSNFYDFFNSEQIAEQFLNAIETNFVPEDYVEAQSSFSLINYQLLESEFSVEITDKRAWMTDVYDCVF